jgi:hypothetical protein
MPKSNLSMTSRAISEKPPMYNCSESAIVFLPAAVAAGRRDLA